MIKSFIKQDAYRDSVFLMRLAAELRKMEGIESADALLATPVNMKALQNAGLSENVGGVTGRDIVIVVKGEDADLVGRALEHANEIFAKGSIDASCSSEDTYSTLAEAIGAEPKANLVFLSIPGPYVRQQAVRALNRGMNVFIFSDNVPVETEVELKQLAQEKGLLVMGPDCGTAIINGVALGFGNGVRRGNIGIVGASGTGLQEVCCLLHQMGQGISQAIGTGGNDVSRQVGGITMCEGIRRLNADSETEVLVVMGKPSDAETEKRIMNSVAVCNKPVVVGILGGTAQAVSDAGAFFAGTICDTAIKAAELASGKEPQVVLDVQRELAEKAYRQSQNLRSEQKYVRGVYSGGTLANETCLILSTEIGDVHSNVSLKTALPLKNVHASVGHTIVDMGEEEFTAGKPHPMLEPEIRNQRIVEEAVDPETAVLLFDMVLGWGTHPDPAEELKPAIEIAKKRLQQEARKMPPVVCYVCGTELDPQDMKSQIRKLEEMGVLVAPTNAASAKLAAAIAMRKLYQH